MNIGQIRFNIGRSRSIDYRYSDRLVPVMKYGEQVIQNTNTIVSVAKKLGVPIIVTEQYPKGLGKTVSDVSNNVEGALTFEKTTFSGCTSEVTSALKD
ncbi:Isochorismatase family protein [Desulfosporosinus lacus DSM 15449]|uniref:Isochorismatase family protein n=1 Tax=Desulfosporosinus lacus DSM 15449 TaxID=1121420 RepID=A0A1M6FUD8_9FIRM|nr:Isochorismatase family protein [Desulfosporosinus lacus DSM 15449]